MDEVTQRAFNEAYGRARHAEYVVSTAEESLAKLDVKAERIAAEQALLADYRATAEADLAAAQAELAEAIAAVAAFQGGTPTDHPVTEAHAEAAQVAAEGNSI